MNLITSTLNDFYHCCKIPVKAISYELNEIYKIGYNEEFETYFPIKDIYTLVHSGEEYLNHSIKISEDIFYKIVNISDLCEHLNLNKSYFCSTFKTTTGHTFCHFLNHFRIEKSKKLLLETDLNMLDIALSVGFNNQNYYCTMFKKFTGKTPLQYKVCNKHS